MNDTGDAAKPSRYRTAGSAVVRETQSEMKLAGHARRIASGAILDGLRIVAEAKKSFDSVPVVADVLALRDAPLVTAALANYDKTEPALLAVV